MGIRSQRDGHCFGKGWASVGKGMGIPFGRVKSNAPIFADRGIRYLPRIGNAWEIRGNNGGVVRLRVKPAMTVYYGMNLRFSSQRISTSAPDPSNIEMDQTLNF